MKRNYLNKDELNDMLLIGGLMDTSAKIRKGWKDRGMMSAEQHKQVKIAETYLKKFYTGVLEQLPVKEVRKLHNYLKEFHFKIYDKYTQNIVFGEYEDACKVMYMTREMFFDWTCEIIDIKCRNCTKCWDGCTFYEMLQANLIPEPTGFDRPNCRYSFGEEEGK